MANEPKNAEEQLKQYAAERRQQVPQEIHPATRGMLQGEVARTYGSPEEERGARLRIRWVQALAWVTIAAAIPIFLMPRNQKATPESLPSSKTEVSLPTTEKPGEAPIILSDSPPGAPTPEAAAAARDEAKQVEKRRAVAVDVVKTPVIKLESAVAASGSVGNNSTQFSFSNASANSVVLNRFQMEQSGQQLRFVDSDQSVYAGAIVAQQGGADAFKAAGLNRTLNQRLVFTGQVVRAYLQQQNSAANSRAANANNNNSDDVRVQGQAVVGNNQIKVDAQIAPTR